MLSVVHQLNLHLISETQNWNCLTHGAPSGYRCKQTNRKETNGAALLRRLQNDSENTLSNLHTNGCSCVFPVLTVNFRDEHLFPLHCAVYLAAGAQYKELHSNRKFNMVACTTAVNYEGLLTCCITFTQHPQ